MYYTEDSIVYFNGSWLKAKDLKLNAYNQSLHYGNSVFEGIRSYSSENGAAIFKSKEHFERFHYSAKVMNIKLKNSVSELTNICYKLLEKNKLESAYIRPLLITGSNMGLNTPDESDLFICAWEWGKLLGEKGLRIMTSSYERPNPKSIDIHAKVSGHYINSILASNEAKAKGYDEALLLDANGFVAEGPGANFFFEKNGELYTCPTDNILSGITRKTIIELSENLGMKIHEKHFRIEEVYGADSAFFTGTAAEVSRIDSLDDNSFRLKWEDSLGKKLSDKYNELVRLKKD